MLKRKASYSLMPTTVFMVEIRDGFDVSTRSNIFPESSWVGSFTILTSPNSLLFQLVCYVLQLSVGLLHTNSPSPWQEGLDLQLG